MRLHHAAAHYAATIVQRLGLNAGSLDPTMWADVVDVVRQASRGSADRVIDLARSYGEDAPPEAKVIIAAFVKQATSDYGTSSPTETRS